MKFARFFFVLFTCSILLIGCDDNSINPVPTDEGSEKPPEQGLD